MRPIWKGHISFGLVNIPAELYSAVSNTEIHFHLVDSRNHARVRYQKVNEETGEEVPWANIAKAYEYDKENFVILNNEEIKNALDEGKQLITIEEFVSAGELPGIYFEKPYYLMPTKHGEKGYFLLKEALSTTQTVGIAKIVIRTKEYLSALMPYEQGLMLNLLYFPQEIKNFQEIYKEKKLADKPTVVRKELDLAVSLINSMKTQWDPERYHDTYREVLMQTIEEKIKTGKTHEIISQEEEPTSTKVVDFMKLLKQSMNQKKPKKTPPKSTKRKTSIKRRK
jgi:DNA end-binding protein Ku